VTAGYFLKVNMTPKEIVYDAGKVLFARRGLDEKPMNGLARKSPSETGEHVAEFGYAALFFAGNEGVRNNHKHEVHMLEPTCIVVFVPLSESNLPHARINCEIGEKHRNNGRVHGIQMPTPISLVDAEVMKERWGSVLHAKVFEESNQILRRTAAGLNNSDATGCQTKVRRTQTAQRRERI
jgi:hypothetical protein